MNILFLNTTYICGGAESVASQILQGMSARGHHVYEIVSYHKRPEPLPGNVSAIYDTKARLLLNRLITHNHGNDSLSIPYSLRRISAFIKDKHIDVIHLHNAHGNFLGIRDIRKLSMLCPVVWTVHDFWPLTGHCASPTGCPDLWKEGCPSCPHLDNYPPLRQNKAAALLKEKEECFNRSSILYTVPSRWMEQQFRQSVIGRQKCICIHNSLDTDLWKPMDKNSLREKYGLPADKHILAFVAADPQKKSKGMDLLLGALEKLPSPEDYLLLIAGREGGLEKIRQCGFAARHFGYISDQEKMNEFYAMADLLVNPSLYETFGLVNIEAMSCGTPVIAFSICAMEEIIADTGWCVHSIDSQSLAKAIEKAFSSADVLREKSLASRQRAVLHFSKKQMLDAFETAYKNAMAAWQP